MVITGVNVDHQQLVDLTQKYFADTTPTWAAGDGVIVPQPDESLAQYTGGVVQVSIKLSQHGIE